MIIITIPEKRFWNEVTNEFITTKECKLSLEHSLVSISKWESKWHKPFLSDEIKTQEETVYYIKCMTLTQNVDSLIYSALTNKNLIDVKKYIDNKMTATWFSEPKMGAAQKPVKKEVITSELIYYWMISLEIPFECQKWHLNRLLTLIKVCNAKAKSANKKGNKRDTLSRNAELNAARRNQLGTSG
ncbi:MAG: hypothetical protein ACNA7U_01190 [Candidatus Izemoplasmataceae bacterium]